MLVRIDIYKKKINFHQIRHFRQIISRKLASAFYTRSNGESKESQIKDTSEETRKNENDDQVYNDKVEEPLLSSHSKHNLLRPIIVPPMDYDIQPSTNVSNSPNTPVMPEDEKRFENLIQLWKHQGK